MYLKVKFNNQNYEAIYNEQSGFYELELNAPKTGGIYEAEIEFEDLFQEKETSSKFIQIWAKERNKNILNEITLVYFLDKDNLEIKDVIEFEDYEFVIDEETNKNTVFNIMKKIEVKNGDLVILQRNGKIDYIGIIEEGIENEDGETKQKITLKYISNIFNRKIILNNENLIKQNGLEDFIAKEIYDNFTNSDDTLLNIKWLDVEVKTHTKITKSVEN